MKKIESLPVPKTGRVDYTDADNRGLTLRVNHNGTKTWSLLYRVVGEKLNAKGDPIRGDQRRITLGSYDLLGLADAREKARDIMKIANSGTDPKESARSAALRRIDGTVEKVAEEMCDLSMVKSIEQMRRYFRLHINPRFGRRPMQDITLAEINEHLDQYVRDGQAPTARSISAYLHKLWKFAHQRGRVDVNIMLSLDRDDIAYEPRSRILSDEELKIVWAATQSMTPPYGQLAQLLMLTGLRKNEVSQARWDEVDETRRGIVVPENRAKNGETLLAPFSDKAWDILQSMRDRGGPYIFSTTGGEKPVSPGGRHFPKMLRSACGNDMEHFTPHDLRRTLRTNLAGLGVDEIVSERVIGHKLQGVAAVYNRYHYTEERRDALNRYAQHLEGLIDEQ
ncbi:MAG: integrase arm-type DNA-binding domain-containing protein [Pseudomonadota bacterium]